MKLTSTADVDAVDFERGGGVLPVVAQHAVTGAVLMLAYADRDAVLRTLETGEMWYWSRSRRALWHKGATSGNTQRLIGLYADCDADTLLALVVPAGPACHTGADTCFSGFPTLDALARTIEARVTAGVGGGYTRRLLTDENLRSKKLGEEAAELVLACARGDAERVAEEAADLLYHTLVAARAAGVPMAEVLAVLERRRSAAAAVTAPDDHAVQRQQKDRAEHGNGE